MYILLFLTYVVAAPLALILDRLLGEDGDDDKMSKSSLKRALDQMQKEEGLDKTENSIVKSVIQLKDKTVRDLFTNLDD